MSPKHILFVDDDVQLVESLARRCRQLGWHVETAHNTLTALSHLESKIPDFLCVDVAMPTGNGLSLCETVLADKRWAKIPVIVLTGKQDEATIRRCQEFSASYVKKGSESWNQIKAILSGQLEPGDGEVARPLGTAFRADGAHPEPSKLHLIDVVFEMLGASENPLCESVAATIDCPTDGEFKMSPWVLCIEDDRDFSLALKLKLEQLDISVVRAFEGLEGVKQAFSRPADAIILDFNLPNGQGDFVLRRLKANPFTRNIPVIVLTGVKDQMLEQRMLSLGAAKFLTKPLDFRKLTEELQQYIEIPV